MAGIDPNIIINSLPEDSKPQGVEKLSKLALDKALALKETAIPLISTMLVDLAVKNSQIPDLCPAQNILDRIFRLRNNIVQNLTSFSNILDSVNTVAGTSSTLLQITLDILTVLKTTKIALNQVNKTSPLASGVTTSLIEDISTGETLLTYDNLGESKLGKVKSRIDASAVPIAIMAEIITEILTKLALVDTMLNKCIINPQLITIPENLSKIQAVQTDANLETVYRGYGIGIVTVPFNSTLSRIKAVAYKDGIPVLETEPSFASQPQILIDQLKLKIDSEF